MLDIFLLSIMKVARALQSSNETARNQSRDMPRPSRDVFQLSKALIIKKLFIEKSKTRKL